MNSMKYIWKDREMVPWDQAQTHVLAHGLHYGSAVFEGIRVYKTHHYPAVFKLREHIKRLFYSAQQIGMEIPYSQEEIAQAVIETVYDNGLEEGYIRPLAYYGYGSMKVVPTAELPVHVVIACWPWGAYLPVKAVDVAISSYIRIHPKSTVANAKISGHYINSIVAGLAIRNTHYHEALLLDAEGYVAEGSAENIFIVKNGKMTTPPLGTILEGITRQTVIEMSHEMGIPVEEKYFKPQDIFNADEAFFTGTAIEVTAIRSLDDRMIADGEIGPVSQKIATHYQQIIRGQVPSFHKALTSVVLSQGDQAA